MSETRKPQSLFRPFAIVVTVLILASAVWGSIYTYRKGFTKKWRRYVNEAFENRGIGAEIGKLTFDPLEGLVARDVEFYRTPEKKRLLATIDRLTLDVDIAKLVRQENFLNAITIDGADLTIPLEDRPGSETISIGDLHADARFPGDSIEVGAITGEFYGARFSVRGSLLRPQSTSDGSNPQSTSENSQSAEKSPPNPDVVAKPLIWIDEHRSQLESAIHWIGRFTQDPEAPPTFEVDLTGDLGTPDSLRATVLFTSGSLGYEKYTADSVQAEITYSNTGTELRSLKITDALGELNAFAKHTRDSDKIPFTIDSGIDLLALIGAIAGPEKVGELIAYEPINLALEGSFLLPGASAERPPGLPAHFTGNVSTGRFASRGTIFTGLGADFAYEPGRYLVRNALIEHRSGTAGFQVAGTPGGDVRFEARLGLDPQVFIPFVRKEGTRTFLRRVVLDADSSLRVDASGSGPSANPDTWEIDATIQGQDFRFNGVPLDRFKTTFHSKDRVQTYTDAIVVRPDGTLRATKVTNQMVPKIITVDSALCTANPQETAAYFSAKLSKTLERFQFERPPTLKLTGVYDIGGKVKTDFEAEIMSGDSNPLKFDLLDSHLKFDKTQGRLRILRQNIGMNFTGTATPGNTFRAVTFPAGADVSVEGWLQKDTSPATDLTVKIATGSKAAVIRFAGKDLPLEDATTVVHVVDSQADAKTSGKIFGGAINVETTVLGAGKEASAPYTTTGTLSGVSLRDITSTFGSTNETGGFLAGSFSFTGRTGDSASVDGTSELTLKNANIYSIPIFGPLSPLLTTVIPGSGRTGYSVSREATASLSASEGVVTLESFEAPTTAFRLRASGTVDYINDSLDLRAKMNLRGAPGIILSPLSKLFEFKATGTLNEPGWRSATLGAITGD